MNFLILLLVVTPIYATGDILGDLLGEELYLVDHIRLKRQAQHQQQISYRPLSQAPPQIQQLLTSQQHRDPLVHIPAQPPPKLATGPRPDPVYQNQAQIASYKPEIRLGSAPQQPNYKQISVPPAQYRSPQGPAQPSGGQYTPQYRTGGQAYPQQQGGYQPQPAAYQPQGHAQAQPQYSNNLPPELRQLLQVQAGLPNSIPHGRQG